MAGKTSSVCRWGLVVLIPWALAGLSGCKPEMLASPIPSSFTVASLPIGAAGIGDDRQLFANHFAAELARSPLGRASHVQAWIHWPDRAIARPTSEASLRGVSVLVIPGIFGDCVADQSLPFSDGVTRTPARNLTEGYTYLASLGLRRVRAVAVGGRVSSMTNGMAIADAIRQEATDPTVSRVIVVGYSKGVADTLVALARLEDSGSPRAPLSFVSLSGVVMGTPLADSHDDLYQKLASRFEALQCTRSDGHEVTSLTRRERVRWLASHPRLPGVNSYTVLAYTVAGDVSPGLRPFYERLARIDPRNDGQMLAADAVLPGSTLLAEVKSDHWTYVLPLQDHPNWLVRGAAANLTFPRAAFFRALLRTVVELDEQRQRSEDLATSQRKL